MKFEQSFYSLINWNCHYGDIHKELRLLETFLRVNNVQVNSAIDIGCGDGKVTTKLRDLLALKVIYGLDLNKRLLERTRERGITTIYGDMESICLEKKFDMAISYGSLYHARNTENFIHNLRRISREYVLIVDNIVRNTFFHAITGLKYFPIDLSPFPIRSREEIVEALEQTGCAILGVRTNLNDNFWHDRSFFLAAI